MDHEPIPHVDANITLREQEERLRRELEKIEKKRAKLDAHAQELVSQINAVKLVLSTVLAAPAAGHKPANTSGPRSSLTGDVRSIVDNISVDKFTPYDIAGQLAELTSVYGEEDRDDLSDRVRKTLARLARDGDTVEVVCKGKGNKGTIYRLITDNPSVASGRSAAHGRIEDETKATQVPIVTNHWRPAPSKQPS